MRGDLQSIMGKSLTELKGLDALPDGLDDVVENDDENTQLF